MAATATSGPAVQYVQDLSIDPTNVTGTISTQTFTAKGLRTDQTIITGQNQTWAAAGFFIGAAYCNAVDVLTLVFINLTGNAYDAASAAIHVIAV